MSARGASSGALARRHGPSALRFTDSIPTTLDRGYFDESAQPSERVHVLNLSESVADTVWVQQPNDTLKASDTEHNDVAAISGPFHPGQAITAVMSRDKRHYLGELNLKTGQIRQLQGLSGVVPAGGLLMVSHGG